MTTRGHLNQIRRRSCWINFTGCAFIAFTLIVGTCGQGTRIPFHPASILGGVLMCGFAMCFAGTLYMLYGGQCVQCRRRLGPVFAHELGWPWRIKATLRFCPYCGESLDKDADGDAASP